MIFFGLRAFTSLMQLYVYDYKSASIKSDKRYVPQVSYNSQIEGLNTIRIQIALYNFVKDEFRVWNSRIN